MTSVIKIASTNVLKLVQSSGPKPCVIQRPPSARNASPGRGSTSNGDRNQTSKKSKASAAIRMMERRRVRSGGSVEMPP